METVQRRAVQRLSAICPAQETLGRRGDSARTAASRSLEPVNSPPESTTVTLTLPDSCRRCVRALMTQLRDVAGVITVELDVTGTSMVVTGTMSRRELEAAFTAALGHSHDRRAGAR